MTKAELIKALERLPDDAQVLIQDTNANRPISLANVHPGEVVEGHTFPWGAILVPDRKELGRF